MDIDELFSFKSVTALPDTPVHAGSGEGGRKRSRFTAAETGSSSVPKKQHLQADENAGSDGMEPSISGEERLRILKMIEDEPEESQMDASALKRMSSVLDKRISRNQEMRIKFPDQPERFMDSELELHESIQELHALATIPELYPIAVELNLSSVLLSLLAHENADISCAVLNLFQEITDVETINENEEATGVFIDKLIDQQVVSVLTQNLDRLDEAEKDEADGVHNTLAIFENLFELRPELCSKAGENGLLQWLLKRIRARIPFDGNKLYAGETLAILLQDTPINRSVLGDLEGIDILLQQLAFYKKHDPSSDEEAEYMENLFNCLCSSLLWGPNREKFLKGEGPQLMNLMLKERKQSRSGALKVLNHAVSGPDGAANANKMIEILGLRTLFPLFMKTPKKAKRKGLTAMEHEEHVVSIIASIFQHVSGQFRGRLLVKYEENEFEKIERLCELHFKYFEKLHAVNMSIKADQDSNETLEEDEIYMRKLDSGLFTLQLVDYIILEVCSASQKCKDKVMKLLMLHRVNFNSIKDIVKDYADNIGDENSQWRQKQQQNIELLLENV
ncbi:unnamed protein product [Allacma fusca]|uniref:Beta-catenin-like protein 1 n=1 Tax=Allacma fusca TaxID=39272 RepID=A0A8J2LRX6_9HEXA|nr:unnamed protein product [Allacma fusca]